MRFPILKDFSLAPVPLRAGLSLDSAAAINRTRERGTVVAVVGNGKGGCGKSTLAMKAAIGFVRQCRGVLVIDADADAEQQKIVKWRRSAVSPNPEVAACEPAAIVEVRARRIGDADAVLIDLPGRDVHALAQVLDCADILISPAKPSRQDLSELGRFVRAAQARKCPHVAVFNEATRESTEEMIGLRAEVAEYGPFLPIAIQQISSYRRIYGYGRGVLDIRPPDPARANFEKVFPTISARSRAEDGKVMSAERPSQPVNLAQLLDGQGRPSYADLASWYVDYALRKTPSD